MHFSGQTGLDVIEGIDLQRLKKIVNEFGLHTNYPASPMPIYRKLGTKLSKQTLPGHRTAYSGWHPKHQRTFAVFDKSLSGLDLDHALWHELSHLLFDHPGHEYNLSSQSSRFYQTGEFICDLRAAYLSVSFNEMMQMYRDGWYDTQVAGALKVPVSYLKLRHEIYTMKEHLYY
jgi:hypothetical protein